ncbi:CsiV family protein [Ectopseudomonas mendocina]|uniref:CsiV family protein n=1 Tax=Ectopseudomonas mendocina TaxID=300 RepID=A0ABZ2RRQ2_ECTME
MRALRSLALLVLPLLCLFSVTTVHAEGLYLVETIVFRQSGQVIPSTQQVPDDWMGSARMFDSSISRVSTLNDEASKLTPENGYEILLHKAWEQSISSADTSIAITEGQGQFGHFPVQGTITLREKRPVELSTDIWINRFDDHGSITESERLKQTSRLSVGELTYLDGGGIGMLIRVRAL